MECWETLIQVGAGPAVRFSEEVESFAEVLETLIPFDSCLFLHLIDLGNYELLWENPPHFNLKRCRGEYR